MVQNFAIVIKFMGLTSNGSKGLNTFTFIMFMHNAKIH